eukprot:CCRYP_009863-RB/>CCRYP_009863-RB protein AED:0.48 eAED:0.78 QI:0/0/0/1/0/0/2/0/75
MTNKLQMPPGVGLQMPPLTRKLNSTHWPWQKFHGTEQRTNGKDDGHVQSLSQSHDQQTTRHAIGDPIHQSKMSSL